MEAVIQHVSTEGKQDLDLSQQKLSSLPECLFNTKLDLVRLGLSDNVLRSLPHDVCRFTKLRYLNISKNQFREFPLVLCEMPSLEILDVSRNKIAELPEDPGMLLNLKIFSLSKNRIKILPRYIAAMEHLRLLKIDANPIEFPPADITEKPHDMTYEAWLGQLKIFVSNHVKRKVEEQLNSGSLEKHSWSSFFQQLNHISFSDFGKCHIPHNIRILEDILFTSWRLLHTFNLLSKREDDNRCLSVAFKALDQLRSGILLVSTTTASLTEQMVYLKAEQCLSSIIQLVKLLKNLIDHEDTRIVRCFSIEFYCLSLSIKDAYSSFKPKCSLTAVSPRFSQHSRTQSSVSGTSDVSASTSGLQTFDGVRLVQEFVHVCSQITSQLEAELSQRSTTMGSQTQFSEEFFDWIMQNKKLLLFVDDVVKTEGNFSFEIFQVKYLDEMNSLITVTTKIIAAARSWSQSAHFDRNLMAGLKNLTHLTKMLAKQLLKYQPTNAAFEMRAFSIVVATSREGGIGKDGKLPWHLPGDMAFFKKLTTRASDGKRNAVVMGRMTWESIPDRFRPLPDRLNVVLTRNTDFRRDAGIPDDVLVCHSLEEALVSLEDDRLDVANVFVIGGAAVYSAALKLAQCRALFVTDVDASVECDAFFSKIDRNLFRLVPDDKFITAEPWIQQLERRDKDVSYKFMLYERIDDNKEN